MLRADIGTGREEQLPETRRILLPRTGRSCLASLPTHKTGHSLRTIRTMENNAYRHSHTAEL